MLRLPHTEASPSGAVAVVLHRVVEPNNQRLLHVATVHHGSRDVTLMLCGSDTCHLYFPLDRWQLCDTDERAYYLPREGSALLLRPDGEPWVSLPAPPLSALHFVGNYFSGEVLIEVYDTQVTLFDISTEQIAMLYPAEGERFQWAAYLGEGQVALLVRMRTAKGVAEQRRMVGVEWKNLDS